MKVEREPLCEGLEEHLAELPHWMDHAERSASVSDWMWHLLHPDAPPHWYSRCKPDMCLGMHEGLQEVWHGRPPSLDWLPSLACEGFVVPDGNGRWRLTQRGRAEIAEPMWRCFACGSWWTAEQHEPLASKCGCGREGVIAWVMPGSEVADAS